MRLIPLLVIGLIAPAVGGAQTLGARLPAAAQHATVSTAVSAASAASGQVVTLWADVTPKPGIHIYAAGAREFSPVALTLVPQPAITAGAVRYPPAQSPLSLKADVDAPAYYSKFRIAQPVTIAAGSTPRTITVNGQVSYQACDDRLCYPVFSEPVSWTISVK